MNDINTVTAIDRDEMVDIAAREYERLQQLLGSLDAEDWSRSTVCADWDVRLMVAHVLGAAEAGASVRENMSQLRRGTLLARRRDAELIDGINAVQVEDRKHLSPTELIDQLAAVAPRAVAGRRKTPGLLRRISMPDGIGGKLTLGHLVDIVYTRDQWMHRIDIAEACAAPLALTADHDGRIVADVVREWAEAHGEPFELHLGGPAGGEYRSGDGGPLIELDAIEFCLILSGRLDKELPILQPIVF